MDLSSLPHLRPWRRAEAFQQGLHELGYIEGKNIVLEQRHAYGKSDQLRVLAAEIIRLKVGVIVTSGPTATRPAKEATATIPIVMTFDDDPSAAASSPVSPIPEGT